MKTFYQCPLGLLEIIASREAIESIRFTVVNELSDENPNPLLEQACRELDEYFKGQRTCFSVPLSPKGSEFQQSVWRELCAIPYGETRSYGDIAKRLGSKGARAVGMANNKNPIPIMIPCHRVIGSNGNLTGYAGGIEKKQQLLELEKAD